VSKNEIDAQINDQQMKFIQELVVEGKPKLRAYMAAYPDASYMAAASSATRLINTPAIAKKIAELREVRDKAMVLDMQEKREFLAKVVRMPIKEVKPDSELLQDVTITTTTDKNGNSTQKATFKMPDKLKAIQVDNAMMGHNASAEVNVTHDISEIFKEILDAEDSLPIVKAKNVTPIEEKPKGPLGDID